MKRILKILFVSGLLLLCILCQISFHRWHSPWYLARAEMTVQTFEFDAESPGNTPDWFWLRQPTRLLLINRNQYNQLENRNTDTEIDIDVWVINVETGQAEWRSLQELPEKNLKQGTVYGRLPLTLPSGERISERRF